ncbi:MAG: GGDEF domain-containing protein [Granulicella sp.]
MEAHSPAVSNLLFFVLYAAVTLAYRRIHRSVPQAVRGCNWFIFSNVLLALPFLEQIIPVLFPYREVTHSALLFTLIGNLSLHRSFAELRDREEELWRSQLGVVAAGLSLWFLIVLRHSQTGGGLTGDAWMSLIFGMQYGLIGLMMFRSVQDMERAAGWFAGTTGVLYGVCNLIWFGVSVFLPKYGWSGMDHGWSSLRMVTHAALTLSFLLLLASRLHIQMHRETELDELTGLLNLRAIRREAAAAIERCAKRGRSIAVVMIDLDGFKEVNDMLGHDAGDVLLCGAGRALKGKLREQDKVARLGGDEFCLLLPGIDEAEAVGVAERCRTTLAEMTILYGGEQLQVTASFGVAHAEAGDADWDELLRKGDRVMYEAKRKGGDRVAVARAGVSAVLTMQGRVWPVTDYREATGINIRS